MPPLSDTSTTWYENVLSILRAPQTAANRDSLRLWAASEGTPASWHNWLATSISGYHGVSVNSAGVKKYPTYKDGVNATVATLRLHFYVEVVAALRANAGELAIWTAINASPWCHGCQHGHYPIALYQQIHGQVPTPDSGPDRNQGEREFEWSAKVRNAGKRLTDAATPALDGVRAIDYLRGV